MALHMMCMVMSGRHHTLLYHTDIYGRMRNHICIIPVRKHALGRKQSQFCFKMMERRESTFTENTIVMPEYALFPEGNLEYDNCLILVMTLFQPPGPAADVMEGAPYSIPSLVNVNLNAKRENETRSRVTKGARNGTFGLRSGHGGRSASQRESA
jgi:hypothetical protein